MKCLEYFLYGNKTKINDFIQQLGTVTSPLRLCQPRHRVASSSIYAPDFNANNASLWPSWYQGFPSIKNYEATASTKFCAASGCDKTQAGSQCKHHWRASIKAFSSYLQKYWYFKQVYLIFLYTVSSSFLFNIHEWKRSAVSFTKHSRWLQRLQSH